MPNRFCNCCGYQTINDQGFDICPICYWEDDPVQTPSNPDYEGGANEPSLRRAQLNYLKFGACEIRLRQYVRKPLGSDKRHSDWQLVPNKIRPDGGKLE